VILDNAFLLPVVQAMEVTTGNKDAGVDLSLTGWWVSDILYLRAEGRVGCTWISCCTCWKTSGFEALNREG